MFRSKSWIADDGFDEDETIMFLQTALTSIKDAIQGGHKFGESVFKLVTEIGDELKRTEDVQINRPIISARACIVCGKDDVPGQQRKSGFKCNNCIGVPSLNRFRVQVEEKQQAQKGFDEDGSKMLNNYVIMRDLGRGQYGKVKMAVHAVSNQPYAVKILDKKNILKRQATAGDGQGDPFAAIMREIKILKHLQHPHIIKMVEVIDDTKENKLYIITEYLSGGQICDIGPDGTVTSPAISIGRTQKYIMGIASGLEYLHQKGIIHRDIKPDNLLLDRNDNIKLSDFGVSSAFGEKSDILTDTQGSPAFWCPEEYSGKNKIGRAADVWAFGVTVFALVFRKLPFIHNKIEDLQRAIQEDTPDMTHERADLTDLISSMLCKDPTQRISIQDIMRHPFCSGVRMVKGVATISMKLNMAVASETNDRKVPKDTDCVIYQKAGITDGAAKAVEELTKFFLERGHEVQLVRAAPYQINLYAPKEMPATSDLEIEQVELTVKSKDSGVKPHDDHTGISPTASQGSLKTELEGIVQNYSQTPSFQSTCEGSLLASAGRWVFSEVSAPVSARSTGTKSVLGDSMRKEKPKMISGSLYGLPMNDNELRMTFEQIDSEGTGLISVEDFVELCESLDDMGLPGKDPRFLEKVQEFSYNGQLSYDSFIILMLKIIQR